MALKSVSRVDAPAVICNRLQRRSLKNRDPLVLREELSARAIAKALGQTTGFLYHHWGSLDAFLFEVSGLGWQRLVESVVRAYDVDRDARAIVHSYIDFAADNPVLYWLLAERPLSMSIVRSTLKRGATLPSFKAFVTYFELLSRAEPGVTLTRARAMHAAAHGIASQLLSNRLGSTPDALEKGERALAREMSDSIAEAFFTSVSKSRALRSPARDPKAARRSRPRKTPPPTSSPKSSRRPKSGS